MGNTPLTPQDKATLTIVLPLLSSLSREGLKKVEKEIYKYKNQKSKKNISTITG
jgi:hypothetical protein